MKHVVRLHPCEHPNSRVGIFEIDPEMLVKLSSMRGDIINVSMSKDRSVVIGDVGLVPDDFPVSGKLDYVEDVSECEEDDREHEHPLCGTPSKIIWNGPATVVFFEDGSKEVVKCTDNDSSMYNPAFGACLAILKHLYADDFKDLLKFIESKVDEIQYDIEIPE